MSDTTEAAADTENVPGFLFQIADISPVPDDEVIAAITAALHEAWPAPASAAPQPLAPDTSWRFGQRRWHDRQIPRRTWGVSA